MDVLIKECMDHDSLVDFYISRGIEFNDDKQYFHPPLFSYIATINDSFVGAITMCKEDDDFILDEVAVLREYEKQGIGTLLINKAIAHIQSKYGNKKIYLVAKNFEVFKNKGFRIIKREEAPNFAECFTCKEFQKTCFPEIMLLDLEKIK